MIAHIASKESILFRRAQILRVQFAILTVKVMSMPERQPITIPSFFQAVISRYLRSIYASVPSQPNFPYMLAQLILQ